jgi:hypothetical protein
VPPRDRFASGDALKSTSTWSVTASKQVPVPSQIPAASAGVKNPMGLIPKAQLPSSSGSTKAGSGLAIKSSPKKTKKSMTPGPFSLTQPSPENVKTSPAGPLVGSTVIVPVGGGSPAATGEATMARTSKPTATAAVVRALFMSPPRICAVAIRPDSRRPDGTLSPPQSPVRLTETTN